jgi:hypothetical protein
VREYINRTYQVPGSYLAVAAKIYWEFPLAYRAYLGAQKVLEIHEEVGSKSDRKEHLLRLLRT